MHLDKRDMRYYPEGALFAPLIGVVNIDGMGVEGVERMYDSWLKGQSGDAKLLYDARHHIVSGVHHSNHGHNLKLTLDRRIQFIAYHALRDG